MSSKTSDEASERKDLFSDLRTMNRSNIEKNLLDLKKQRESLESHIKVRKGERKSLIERVKAARSSISEINPNRDVIQKKRHEISIRLKALGEVRKFRDKLNEIVPLPISRLLELQKMQYNRLVLSSPKSPTSLDEEKKAFGEYFLIKSKIELKKLAVGYHEQVVNHIQAVDILRQEVSSATEKFEEIRKEVIESSSTILPTDLSYKSIKKLSSRIDEMKKEIGVMYDNRRLLNREIGRINAFFKHSNKKSKYKHKSKRNDALEASVLSGETFGMDDLANLLASGTFEKKSKQEKKSHLSKKSPSTPKRRSPIAARRGEKRIGRADRDQK